MGKIIKAIIPVRSGSKRVVNKNIRPFADSNLLTIKIKQLKEVEGLDGIVVNSNDDTMLEIARNLGVEAVKRDERYAQDDVINQAYRNMAENCDCDVVMHTIVTATLIETNTISKLIQLYRDNCSQYDSVNTVVDVKEFLWQDGRPINYDPSHTPRSQDLPDIVAITHAINIIDRQKMIETTKVIGDNPYFYKLDRVEAVDIDTMLDFEFAEFLYKKYRMNQ